MMIIFPSYAQMNMHDAMHEMIVSNDELMQSKSMHTHGMYSSYSLTREASGTSWQPQSTPHTSFMEMSGNTMFMVQGFLNQIYDNQGGIRGGDKNVSTSMLMLMTQKDLEVGTVGFRSMFSLDPLMGSHGYPLILQTGETGNGRNLLVDRQHPHDAIMELAATYSRSLSEKKSMFIYIGLPGEPALGPPNFMMRWSAMYIPEAAITHHWFDSTHISYGVVTLGYIFNNVKLDISTFKGREPDQSRWNIESPRLDSQSARISYNPNDNWSLQISYGHLKSPEQLEPNVNTNRAITSVIYNLPFKNQNNWQTTLAVGQNKNYPGHTLTAYLLESTVNFNSMHTFFGRFERVQKDELFEEPSPFVDDIFTVNKLSIGYLYEFSNWYHAKPGVGVLFSTYALPRVVQGAYGSHPFSFMIFGRIDLV